MPHIRKGFSSINTRQEKEDVVVRIKRETYDRIVKYGKYGDTFDRVLVRVLDEGEKR